MAFLLALLAGLAGVFLDHVSRAALNYVKTGTFEVYVSNSIYKVLIPVAIAIGGSALLVSRKARYPELMLRLSSVLMLLSIIGFLILIAISI